MSNPRAFTKEEVCNMLLRQMVVMAHYWENEPRAPTSKEKLSGFAFSLLNIFDGTSMALPAFSLSPSPHPDDKQYHIDNDENWFDDSEPINDDCCLHDLWHEVEKEVLIQDQEKKGS